MAFENDYICDRCKKEIKGNTVIINFEGSIGQSHFRDGVDLCNDCFLELVDWIKSPQSKKVGPVERVAKREDSK